MQQEPLDYESPPRDPKQVLRRTVGRIVVGAWLLFGVASALLVFNASDRNPLQWPAAMFMALTMFLAAVLSVVYWGVVVVLWFRKRADANT